MLDLRCSVRCAAGSASLLHIFMWCDFCAAKKHTSECLCDTQVDREPALMDRKHELISWRISSIFVLCFVAKFCLYAYLSNETYFICYTINHTSARRAYRVSFIRHITLEIRYRHVLYTYIVCMCTSIYHVTLFRLQHSPASCVPSPCKPSSEYSQLFASGDREKETERERYTLVPTHANRKLVAN